MKDVDCLKLYCLILCCLSAVFGVCNVPIGGINTVKEQVSQESENAEDEDLIVDREGSERRENERRNLYDENQENLRREAERARRWGGDDSNNAYRYAPGRRLEQSQETQDYPNYYYYPQ